MQKLVPEFTNYFADRYDKTNYLARNIYDPNDGYVLWRRKSNLEMGFRVQLTVGETNVICEVIPFE